MLCAHCGGEIKIPISTQIAWSCDGEFVCGWLCYSAKWEQLMDRCGMTRGNLEVLLGITEKQVAIV